MGLNPADPDLDEMWRELGLKIGEVDFNGVASIGGDTDRDHQDKRAMRTRRRFCRLGS